MLLRKFRPNHYCQKKMHKPSAHQSPKTNDTLVYSFRDNEYRMFVVDQVYTNNRGEEKFRATELNIQPKFFKRAPELDFGVVGGFINHGKLYTKVKLKKSDIDGKCIQCQKMIFTFHNDVLVDN